VRKMTSQAADRIRVADRGILRPGMKADIIVFDEAAVRDLATYEQPNQFSDGISSVVVNGEIVLRDGVMTNALPGRPIRGRGYEQR
jgi:N-acyl-D-amino-acid deacylase